MGESALRDVFKEVMARVASPVSVVTTTAADGSPCGATVSAFSSLSLTPAMIMIALDARSATLAVIRDSGRFGLNVLGADQAGLALSFAAKGVAQKFAGIAWHLEDGLPRLPQAPAWIAASVVDLVDGGDHVIVIGGVAGAAVTSERQPLVYYQRRFGTHSPHLLTGLGS